MWDRERERECVKGIEGVKRRGIERMRERERENEREFQTSFIVEWREWEREKGIERERELSHEKVYTEKDKKLLHEIITKVSNLYLYCASKNWFKSTCISEVRASLMV